MSAERTVRRALADAAEYRRNHPGLDDLALVAEYGDVAAGLAAGALTVAAPGGSVARLGGGAELAAPDVATVLGALADAVDYRAARGDAAAAAAYRDLARALGGGSGR